MRSSASAPRPNPFERLPLDLFSIAVHLALKIVPSDHFPPFGQVRDLQRLRLVTKSWNAALEAMSSVWTLLDCTDPPMWIIKSIVRAGNSYFHIRYDTYDIRHMEFADFMGIVVHVLPRWKSLFISYHQPFDMFEPILYRSAPNLQHIVVRSKGMAAQTEYGGRFAPPSPTHVWPWDGFLGGGAPGLVSLRIHSQPFQWNSGLLTNSSHLRWLEIHKPFDEEMSLIAFLGILSVLPRLTHLTIYDILFEEDDDEDERPAAFGPNSVVLDELIKLEWSATADNMNLILNALQYPTDCELTIRCRGEANERPKVFKDILSSLEPQLSRLGKNCGGGITLALSGNGWVNLSTESRALWLEFTQGWTLTPLTTLLQTHKDMLSSIPTSLMYNFSTWEETSHYQQNSRSLSRFGALLPGTSILVVMGDERRCGEVLEAMYAQGEASPIRQAFKAIKSIETPKTHNDGFYNALITRLREFQTTIPDAQPPMLRFPAEDDDHPKDVDDFVEECSWAELHYGPSAKWEEFEDMLPTEYYSQIIPPHRLRLGEY